MEKFKTVKELNIVAAVMKIDRNLTGLIELAEKYGLEKEDAEDYMNSNDEEDTLCNETMAAIGKLKLEAEDLKLESQMKDWKDFVVQILMEYPTQHMEEDGAALANAVFNPDKHLLDVLAAGLKLASKNRVTIDKRITKAAGLPDSAGQIGMCGRDELKKIVLDYYMGKKA